MGHVCTVDWKLVLEYLKVVLSWPVIGGAAIFVGASSFRTELKSLLGRVATVEIAGAKLVTQQAAPDEASDEAAPPTPDEDATPVALDDLPLNDAERRQLEDAFKGERAAVRMWEYRYMNFYFAPSTQAVINWFATLPQPTTLDAYHAYWTPRLMASGERDAILSALERHFCIQVVGQTISLSDKGREYAEWPERRLINVPVSAYLHIPARTFLM